MSAKSVGGGARLDLRISGGGGADELPELCDVLRDAGAEGVKRPLLADPTPGYRGTEDTIADVVATVEPTVGAIGRVLGALRSWLAGRPRRTVELTIGEATIKLNGLSSANEDRLVDLFVRRVAEDK